MVDPDIRLRGREEFNMFPLISHLSLRWRGLKSRPIAKFDGDHAQICLPTDPSIFDIHAL